MTDKKESIKTRIVLPFLIVIISSLLLAGYGSFLLRQHHLNTEADTRIESVRRVFAALLDQEALRMGSQLELIAGNEKMLAAWRAKDRNKLQAAAQPFYEKLNQNYGVTHFYFIDPEKVCFLRVHAPARYGDPITLDTLEGAARLDRLFSGIELGPLGTFTLRVVYPWKHENRLLGYLELGEDIENLSPFLKANLGLDVILLIDKTKVERQNWEYGRESLGRKDKWNDFARFVIAGNTMGNLHPGLKDYLAKGQFEENRSESIEVDGRNFRLAVLPVTDIGKRMLGKMVVLYDATAQLEAHQRILTNIAAVVLSIMGVFFIFFYYYTDHLEEKLKSYQEKLETKVAERTSELATANEKLLVELSARKEVQKKLRRSQEEWRKSFNALSDIVTIQDREMRVLKANKAAYTLLGRDGELVGRHCYEVFRGIETPCEGCPVSKTLFDFGRHTEVITHQRLGKTFVVSSSPTLDENGEVEFIVHVAKDISQQKKMEEELLQSRKLEAIGTLAGGIAHDFNNILMAILGYVELAKENITDHGQAVADLDEAIKGARRARELVRQILVFSRKEEYEVEPLFPHLIVKESLKLLRASLPASIEIREEIDPDCGAIMADPVKVQQILMNLCTNALHAMENGEGVLRVSLCRTELSEAEISADYHVSAGPFIELKVSDTGHGMDQAVMARIFEPFFTTKDVDKGTGMGLAVVHGIVRDFGGMIKVESSPGKGATFTVYLPAMFESGQEKAAETKPEELPRGSGKILCLDDEESIVNLQKSFLERHGYEVTSFTNSLEALEHFRETKDQWHLLITDQTMPQMTGERLVPEILKIRPDMPIILCTGYSARISEEKARALGIRAFVMKPIDLNNFALLVRRVLSGAGGPGGAFAGTVPPGPVNPA